MSKKIYMLGICGTGMGNLALMLKKSGYTVTGSDSNVYPPMSTTLENAGIKILKGYNEHNFSLDNDIAIIGNVIRRDNPEAQKIINSDIEYYSMPEALNKFFLADKKSIVVTGTHGKTTTSFMMAWTLENAGLKPGFFVGGIPKDFETMGRPALGEHFVIEGDEYDTAFFDKEAKFFHYKTKHLIINGIEFDHADIYPNIESIKNAFGKLIGNMPSDGVIVYNADDKNVCELILKAKCKTVSFAVNNTKADFRLSSLKIKNTENFETEPRLEFKITNNNKTDTFELKIPGLHNAINATAIFAMSTELGLDIQKVKHAFASFSGVKRRQDVYGISGGRIIIDDFAHHPTAVSYTIDAIQDWYAPRKVWSLMEARSATSRTNILQNELIEALSKAQNVMLAPVNQPERVAEEKRFSPELVCKTLKEKGINANHYNSVDDMVEYLSRNTAYGDVILLMSNGEFGGIYEKLIKTFKE